MNKREKRLDWVPVVARLIYLGLIALIALAVLWPKPETADDIPKELTQSEQVIIDDKPVSKLDEPEVVEFEPVLESYPATRMTHYVMDGNDANTCIAGRWCIGNQLVVADDTSVKYQGYYVFAVHCSVVKEWRGSLIKVYYTDGGVETGIVLDCGGFAGHKDRMDKAMGTRYNGKRDNYTLSRYISKTEVIRKGW